MPKSSAHLVLFALHLTHPWRPSLQVPAGGPARDARPTGLSAVAAAGNRVESLWLVLCRPYCAIPVAIKACLEQCRPSPVAASATEKPVAAVASANAAIATKRNMGMRLAGQTKGAPRGEPGPSLVSPGGA